MTTKIDALIHLPITHLDSWKRVRDGYARCVIFKCEHGNNRYATLTVCANDEGAATIFVRLDGVVRELSVGEYADPFSTANEMLVAFSRNCDRHIYQNGEAL